MRLSPFVLAAFVLTPVAFAADASSGEQDHVDCTVDAKGNDRVAKGRDVVVQAGETVDDAVAVDGNVIIRSGAHVKSALALHGSVTVEAGAIVDGAVVAIGGRAHVDPGAKVKQGTLALDKHHGLQIRGDDGKSLDVSVNLGGSNLADEMLKPMIASIHRCRVIESRH